MPKNTTLTPYPDFFAIIRYSFEDGFDTTLLGYDQATVFINELRTDVFSLPSMTTFCTVIDNHDDLTEQALNILKALDEMNDENIFQFLMDILYNQGFTQGMDICSNIQQFLNSKSGCPEFIKDHIFNSKAEIAILTNAFPESSGDASLRIKCPTCWQHYKNLTH